MVDKQPIPAPAPQQEVPIPRQTLVAWRQWCAQSMSHAIEHEISSYLSGTQPVSQQEVQEPDVADIIAGALQTSRAHAYDLMRDALAAAPMAPQQEPCKECAGTGGSKYPPHWCSECDGKGTNFKAPPQPAPTDGWLQSGSLLYRLTDDRNPRNRDEIRVTMADGSHTPEACARRAGELLDRIRAAPMSPINRMIAYSAATKLRELGFAWDEASEAWLNSAAPQQAAPAAEWLEQAYREGWAACRDAETIGQEAEDWAFGTSTANSRMIDMQQAAPQQEVQEPVNLYPGCSHWGGK